MRHSAFVGGSFAAGYSPAKNGGPDSPPAEACPPAIFDGDPNAGLSSAVKAEFDWLGAEAESSLWDRIAAVTFFTTLGCAW